MTKPTFRTISVAVLALVFAAAPFAQEHQHGGEKLGTVHFMTSCSAPAQTEFDRAMALLHSFEFGPAIEGFNAAVKADASCGISYWGIALARWGNPFAAMIRPAPQIQQGLDAITQAQKIGAKSERERAYIAAASKLYADAATVNQPARLGLY